LKQIVIVLAESLVSRGCSSRSWWSAIWTFGIEAAEAINKLEDRLVLGIFWSARNGADIDVVIGSGLIQLSSHFLAAGS